MKAFPGFDDQAAFPVKLDEILDQLVGQALGRRAVVHRPTSSRGSAARSASASGPIPTSVDASEARVARAAERQRRRQGAGVDRTAWSAEDGATSTTEDLQRHVTITLVDAPGDVPAMGLGDTQGAYAVVGPVLAMGDVASVKAVIDTGGTTGLSTERAVPGGRGVRHRRPARLRLRRTSRPSSPSARALAGDAESHAGAAGRRCDELTPPWIAGRGPRPGRRLRHRHPLAARRGRDRAHREHRVDAPRPRPADDRLPRRGPRRRRDADAGQGPARRGPRRSKEPIKQLDDALAHRRRLRRRRPAGWARSASRSRVDGDRGRRRTRRRADRRRGGRAAVRTSSRPSSSSAAPRPGLSVTERGLQRARPSR